MRSGPIAATVALLSLALVLSGCGDGGAATTEGEKVSTGAAPSEARAKASVPARSPVAARRCRNQLGDLLDSSESLTNTLAVGLSYDQYLASVNRVRASYADVAAERLGIVCLGRVAAPAEGALNLYIDAANEWGECLASSSCDLESVEPGLQREWERASDRVARAQRGLRDLGQAFGDGVASPR